MKKRIAWVAVGLLSILSLQWGYSQSTAMDFNRVDCNGNPQSLFADLDAGNAVILEFFMANCSPCVQAAGKLESMKADLLAEFPGKVKGYAIGFTNSYNCTSVSNWVNANAATSVPMDSGAAQVAYYGGMGMPTIVILGGGTAHSLLQNPYIGFSTSDTTSMAAAIRGFLASPTGVAGQTSESDPVTIFPNPANDRLEIQLTSPGVDEVSLALVDLAGRQVASWKMAAGTTAFLAQTSAIANGSYILRVMQDGRLTMHQLMVSH